MLRSSSLLLSHTGVRSHYILQPSSALSFLLKPVVSKELLLPCSLPLSAPPPPSEAAHTIQVGGGGGCRNNVGNQKRKWLCFRKMILGKKKTEFSSVSVLCTCSLLWPSA